MTTCPRRLRRVRATAALLGLAAARAGAQASAAAPPPASTGWTTAEDHRQMLAQLGIGALRPGPSGNERDPDHANYDEATATPFATLPDVLTLKDGRRVTDARLWARRRAELVADFEREVYGRVPAGVPAVTWTVAATDTGTVGGRRVIGRRLVGRVADAAHPALVRACRPTTAPGSRAGSSAS